MMRMQVSKPFVLDFFILCFLDILPVFIFYKFEHVFGKV